MLNVSNPQIFTDANSIKLKPIVSAEWNQNLFCPPYITVAGSGVEETISSTTGTIENADVVKTNFTTKQFTVASGSDKVSYLVSSTSEANAYKAVTYIRTNTAYPVLINTSLIGQTSASLLETEDAPSGSSSIEVDSFKWTKIETYVGSQDAIVSLEYIINASILVANGEATPSYDVYFTEPEIYETTLFDYKYNSLWPTDSPFKFFRPGESYIKTGNNSISLPSNYRRVATQIGSSEVLSGGYYGNKYMPISPICYSPGFAIMQKPQSSIMKNALPTNLMPYQYFISDTSSKILTAIYEKNIYANKIVIKFNNIFTSPTAVDLTINGSSIGPFVPNSNGVLVLYWTGSAWSTTAWSSMPVFNDSAVISKYTTINKITIETTEALSTIFSDPEYSGIASEADRMQIIEISPRLEIDISNLVQTVSINKSLDAENSQVPISSLNSNDATITLSGIPTFVAPNDIIPIFSNQSNYSKTVLKKMLTKNVKFYINFYAEYGFDSDTSTQYPSYNTYIPGGIFYTDSWSEQDADTVDIQLFDSVRYLQSTQVPDYVANIKPIFDVITNILDLSGFTDYDYDSLYNACNSKSVPVDIAYYYCNSRDTTIAKALSEIFMAYQIGAYIDEYGIMKFLSLAEILDPQKIDPVSNSSIINISSKDIVESGYSLSNKQKPGKISVRYQPPQIKQSASLQNITNPDIKNSPSFVLTTSNDVNWTQEQLDSVGFNYLNDDMLKEDFSFNLNINDLLDIFRTYSLNFSGYAAIEDEIVSFKYKEYNITKPSTGDTITVSVKNDLELTSQINKFTKEYSVGLQLPVSVSSTTSNTVSGGNKTFTVADTDGFSKYGRAEVRQTTTSSYSSGGAAGSTSFTISTSNANIKVGQKIIGSSQGQFADNTVVRSVSGTTINFYPAAIGQISGTVTFAYQDQYMAGYITSVTPTTLSITVDSFGGKNTASSWYINNVPNYDILVEPTGNINHVDRGVFNTAIADHKIIGTALSDKDMSEATIEYVMGPPASSSVNTSSTNAEGLSGKIAIATAQNKKVLVYPTVARDCGYQTYSTKFSFVDNPTGNVCVGGLFFNLDSFTNFENSYFVELTQYRESASLPWKYMVVIYRITSSDDREIIAYADITYLAQFVLNAFPNIHQRMTTPGDDKYAVATDSYWHLKVVHQSEKAADGNVAVDNDKTISVYLNNIEISNWQVAGVYSNLPIYSFTGSKTIVSTGTITFDINTNINFDIGDEIYIASAESPNNYMFGQVSDITDSFNLTTVEVNITASNGSGTFSSWNVFNKFEPQTINYVTGLRKKVDLPYSVTPGTIFGVIASTMMVSEILFTTPPGSSEDIFEVRELYATQTPLISPSTNYYYQDRNFLNGILLNQKGTEKSYCMQTTPEVSGINYYDVEYDSPAAVVADIYPVEYNWHYFPGDKFDDQKYRQVLTVNDYAVAYSTVVNTGFRGKFVIANNSPHVVFLNKDSDDLNQFNIRLNVWTHEIIAQSAQENIEKIVDIFNSSETIQIDSEWLQSRDAAEKMVSTVAAAIDPFSKDISLDIFGNPLIQVGDIINLDYPIKGINDQKHLVKAISHSFDSGLSTKLSLSALNDGVDY